jgi:hypothetical protein
MLARSMGGPEYLAIVVSHISEPQQKGRAALQSHARLCPPCITLRKTGRVLLKICWLEIFPGSASKRRPRSLGRAGPFVGQPALRFGFP